MQNRTFDGQFYETYYFASAIRNILHDQFEYLRFLNDFYGDMFFLPYTKPFARYSAFHSFIEFVVSDIIFEEIGDFDIGKQQNLVNKYQNVPNAVSDMRLMEISCEHAFRYYGIEFESFTRWLKERGKQFLDACQCEVEEYIEDLQLAGPLDLLIEKAVNEVFYILFQNRHLLLLFNGMMANRIEQAELNEIPVEFVKFFQKNGQLKRVNLPAWVKRAIFFRDRGFCTSCRRDLSGLINISNQKHFDHIVPLAQGGLNDVTNIQLLCSDCNLVKSGKMASTSNIYESWYSMLD